MWGAVELGLGPRKDPSAGSETIQPALLRLGEWVSCWGQMPS